MAAAGAMLAQMGCRDDEDEGVTPVEMVIVEDARYSVPRPEGFEAAIFGTSLRLQEAGDLRAPRDIRVDLGANDALAAGETRERGGYTYQVIDAGAGSGGTMWELVTTKTLNDVVLRISASEQHEGEAPEFGWAWPVIEGIAVHP